MSCAQSRGPGVLAKGQVIHVLHSPGQRTISPEPQQLNAGNGGSENHNATYAEQPLLRHHHAYHMRRRRQNARSDEYNRRDTKNPEAETTR